MTPFGPLRRLEIILIEIKDAMIGKLASTEFTCETKRGVKGLRLKFQDCLVDMLAKRAGQSKEGLANSCRLARSCNSKSKFGCKTWEKGRFANL